LGESPQLAGSDLEVCERIARGETNKEIAAGLGVSEQTAKWHVSRLLRRYSAPNRAALAAAYTIETSNAADQQRRADASPSRVHSEG
jgi:DNA-binding CsgD family transcriptional regulator